MEQVLESKGIDVSKWEALPHAAKIEIFIMADVKDEVVTVKDLDFFARDRLEKDRGHRLASTHHVITSLAATQRLAAFLVTMSQFADKSTADAVSIGV